MPVESELEYLTRRERQARELAAAAADPQIRKVHLAMADAYGKIIAGDAFPRLSS